MTTEAAFIATIVQFPDDDGPKLVWADWLEEHGECDRATRIRETCANRYESKNRWDATEKVEDLLGQILAKVENTGDEITLMTVVGEQYKMYHDQDCCENVRVEDVVGDLADMVGSPLTMAEEISSDDHPAPANADSFTWTFYRFATSKGYVTIRWLGESNGYYSESVTFRRVR